MKLKKRTKKSKGNQHSLGYSLPRALAFSKITFQALREEASDMAKALEVPQISFQFLKTCIVFHEILMKQNIQGTLRIRRRNTDCGERTVM